MIHALARGVIADSYPSGGLQVKDQRLLVLHGPERSRITVGDQRAYVLHGPERSRITVGDQRAYVLFDETSTHGLLAKSCSETAYSASGTTITVNLLGVDNGDTLILQVSHYSTLTTPSGWTLEGESAGTSPTGVKIAVFSRVADGSEGASLTITQSGSGWMNAQITGVEGTVASITTSFGVVEGGSTGAMSTGAVSVTSGVAIMGGAWENGYAFLDRACYIDTAGWLQFGSPVYKVNRMAIAARHGLPGVSETTVDFRCQYVTTSDYVWAIIEIEA